jgi:hypothetical protein
MTDVPIIIIGLIIGVIAIIVGIGYLYKTKFPISAMLFFSGTILLLVFLTTDNIILGYVNEASGLFSFDLNPPVIDNITTSGGKLIQSDTNVVILGTSNSYSYRIESAGTSVTIINTATNTPARGEGIGSASSIMLGKKVQCIDIPLSKTGSPIGNATIGVFNALDANTPFRTFGILDVSTLTTSFVYQSYCLGEGTEHTGALNDIFGISYNSGTAINYISTQKSTTDIFDGTNTQAYAIINPAITWTSSTGDHNMRLYDQLPTTVSRTVYEYDGNEVSDYTYLSGSMIGNGTGVSSLEPILYEIRNPVTLEPTFIGISLIILSLSFVVMGVLVESGRFT